LRERERKGPSSTLSNMNMIFSNQSCIHPLRECVPGPSCKLFFLLYGMINNPTMENSKVFAWYHQSYLYIPLIMNWDPFHFKWVKTHHICRKVHRGYYKPYYINLKLIHKIGLNPSTWQVGIFNHLWLDLHYV
jgi:hypothetical protein